MGVQAFVRHAKTGDEGTWWPSATVPEEGWETFIQATHRNLPQEFIWKAHNNSQFVILYYWTQSSAYHAKKYPKWVSLNRHGKPNKEKRSESGILCVNSPWTQVYTEQLLEMAAMGADGFYYDHYTNPPTGCWCDYCKAKFKNETGLDAPDAANSTWSNKVFRKYMEFNTKSIKDHWDYVTTTVSEKYPNIAHLISIYKVPCANDGNLDFMKYNVLNSSFSSMAKTEFTLADRGSCVNQFKHGPAKLKDAQFSDDIMQAWGWAGSRDTSDGRMPHVWAPHIKLANESLTAAFAMLTYGCIANIDNQDNQIPNFAAYNSTYYQGNLLDPWLANHRPMRFAAVYFSEELRTQLMFNEPVAPNKQLLWDKLLFATLGAFETFVRFNVPVGIVADFQMARHFNESGCKRSNLADLGYKFVLIPMHQDLVFPYALQELKCFQEHGGHVVYVHNTTAWGDPTMRTQLQGELLREAERVVSGHKTVPPLGVPTNKSDDVAIPCQLQQNGRPIIPTSHPLKVHTSGFVDNNNPNNMTFLISNDWTWIYEAGPEHTAPPPPAPVSGLELVVHWSNTTGLKFVAGLPLEGDKQLPVDIKTQSVRITLPLLTQSVAVSLQVV